MKGTEGGEVERYFSTPEESGQKSGSTGEIQAVRTTTSIQNLPNRQLFELDDIERMASKTQRLIREKRTPTMEDIGVLV